MASCNIGGMTIHSWGAVSPNSHSMDKESVVKHVRLCKTAAQRWKNAAVLIIDEGMRFQNHRFHIAPDYIIKFPWSTGICSNN
ncbi:hypothetical protein MPER_05490 [Moniliophthora perniciosa FA553]|nr:hypothetical protein MPER_05490 [Moniliophthora perniciosa FA553]